MILASGSPQRRAILASLGLSFEVRAPKVSELEDGDPGEVALENARRKARAVASGAGDALVLAADTVVALEGRLYGKPRDAEDARSILLALAGCTHRVITGLCVIGCGRERITSSLTLVSMRPAESRLLEWCLSAGEWEGRAGGYAIQGRSAAMVARIDGDYTNVVGLPVPALLELEPQLIPGNQGE